MSYAGAAALQAAIWQHLSTLPELVDMPVYDAVPPASAPETYVLIGTEEAVDASDKGAAGAEHRLVISVVTTETGFSPAKVVAAVICDALATPALTLTRGRLAGLWFAKAVARKIDNGAVRRIDLTFRARVDLG
jgi:hypothetical protein